MSPEQSYLDLKQLYLGIKAVLCISKNETDDNPHECPQCSQVPADGSFDEVVSHYLEDHGYHLLHIGTQSTKTDRGLSHDTVVILGR